MGPDITIFYNALLTVIKRNNIQTVSQHIDRFRNLPGKRFNFNDQDMFGRTLAHYLVEHLNTLEVNYSADIITKFLTLGIDLNVKDINGKLAIDLCSKDAARAIILEKLVQYKAATPPAPIKKPLLERLAADPTSVITGSIDGKNPKNYLEGFPYIHECHCTDSLCRETEGIDLRKDFEENTLKYLKDLPGENEVTVIGSGNLLDTLVLIAKFKKDNPRSTLRLNLVEKGYEVNNGLKMKELFADFVRCMKENDIKLTIAENQTNIRVLNVDNAAAEFNLTISLYNDFKKYLELHRTPKLLVGVDLDCEQYALQQHVIIEDLAKQTQAKAFVSVSTGSLKKALVAAAPILLPSQAVPVEAVITQPTNQVKLGAERDQIAGAGAAAAATATSASNTTLLPQQASVQTSIESLREIESARALKTKPKASPVTPLLDSTKSATPSPISNSSTVNFKPSEKDSDSTLKSNPEKPGG